MEGHMNNDLNEKLEKLERENLLMKRSAIVIAVIGCVVALLAGQEALAQARAVASSTVSGRWQIVNPTPERAMYIMLLDTATGATWIACSGEGGTQTWCIVEKSFATSKDYSQVP
jgi:hypothetical protein